jgi:hypothetical protein
MTTSAATDDGIARTTRSGAAYSNLADHMDFSKISADTKAVLSAPLPELIK